MQLNETIPTLSFSFFHCSIHEFTASRGFHSENSRVMDRNRGRHRTHFDILEMQDQLYSFLQMAPQLHLAARVTCHLTAAVILSVQQQGPIAILLFLFHLYANLLLLLHSPACPWQHGLVYAPHTQIRTFMSAGISKSSNLTDWDIASECPFPLIFYMNIKQSSVTVKATNDWWLSRPYAADRSLALKCYSN